MTLSQLQDGLAVAIRGGPPSADPYLQAVAASEELEVLQECIAAWVELCVRGSCPLAVALLESRGRLRPAIDRMLTRHCPAHPEELALALMDQVIVEGDPLLEAVVAFERAMLARREGVRSIVRWPCDPHALMSRIAAGQRFDDLPFADVTTIVEPGRVRMA